MFYIWLTCFKFSFWSEEMLQSLPSYDRSLAWSFILHVERDYFLLFFFCPLLSFIRGCLYFHFQAMLHGSFTAKPTHCAWRLLTLSRRCDKNVDTLRGFIPDCSLMCPTNCSSRSQHLPPNTQPRPTLNYYFFTGASVDDLAAGLEVFIRDHLSTSCPGKSV